MLSASDGSSPLRKRETRQAWGLSWRAGEKSHLSARHLECCYVTILGFLASQERGLPASDNEEES